MSRKRNALLAGVAGLALLAATNFAVAQQSQNPQGAETPGKASPSMTSSPAKSPDAGAAMKSSEAGAAEHAQSQSSAARGGMGEHGKAQAMQKQGMQKQGMQKTGPAEAQVNKSAKPGGTAGKNEGAQNLSGIKTERNAANSKTGQNRNQASNAESNRKMEGKQAAQGEVGKSHNRTAERSESMKRRSATAREERGRMRTHTAQRNGSLKGLQGNAAMPMRGESVRLTDKQRTTIRESVIDARNAPRVGHVDFDIRVGTLVPRREIHVVRVPETLVEIQPEWRGYLYFVYEDEVVIVNPRDMRIVAVLDV